MAVFKNWMRATRIGAVLAAVVALGAAAPGEARPPEPLKADTVRIHLPHDCGSDGVCREGPAGFAFSVDAEKKTVSVLHPDGRSSVVIDAIAEPQFADIVDAVAARLASAEGDALRLRPDVRAYWRVQEWIEDPRPIALFFTWRRQGEGRAAIIAIDNPVRGAACLVSVLTSDARVIDQALNRADVAPATQCLRNPYPYGLNRTARRH